ncbi:MAG: RasGEF domain-containing protein [Amphiamblys sp. WSBS2006]|nr:MAG: RasGEF domain-containing protein [Amphiamblys sp. WSBS2006]
MEHMSSSSSINTETCSSDLVISDEEEQIVGRNENTQKQGSVEAPKQWTSLHYLQNRKNRSDILYDASVFEKTSIITSNKKQYRLTDILVFLTTKIDYCLLSEFLLMYKTFVPPSSLLQLVVIFFRWTIENKVDSMHKVRVFILLKTYLEEYYEKDIFPRKDLLEMAAEHISVLAKMPLENADSFIVAQTMAFINETEKKCCKKHAKKLEKKSRFSLEPETNFLWKYPAEEVARQLTVFEARKFRSVNWRNIICEHRETEWFAHAEKNTHGDTGILSLVSSFNSVCKWIIREFTQAETISERIDLVTKLIETARQCLGLKNYNTAVEIALSLQTDTIQSMKRTWEAIDKKTKSQFKELVVFSSPIGNFKKIRARLGECTPKTPHIPFVPLYINDLLLKKKKAFQDNIPMLSVDDITFISLSIKKAQHLQNTVALYQIEPIETVQEYILKQTA